MTELFVLDLRKNNISGTLPPLCAQSTSLTTIVLNGNHFEGTLPISLYNCRQLEVFDVGNNAIYDTFPARLGTLQALQVFENFKAMTRLDGVDEGKIKYMSPILGDSLIYEDSVVGDQRP
ncbi:hypothetical protein K7X08_015191 [Anisodus acutangulus]|uniref:Uncharacterized protein n=1 Tax=Anisodus acutangulus TaxID=402998 RepID=A0A9Q1L5D8_9SOLA|nr:hypothetical protein K7X08_015191 [Anisodus acutangulus]